MHAELSVLETTSRYRGRGPHGAYRVQQVLSASPQELVLMVYDHVIASCKAHDRKGASAGIAALIDALDLKQGEIALGLFRLYRYSMDMVWQGRFEDALSVVRPLREAWSAAAGVRAGSAHAQGNEDAAAAGREGVGASAWR